MQNIKLITSKKIMKNWKLKYNWAGNLIPAQSHLRSINTLEHPEELFLPGMYENLKKFWLGNIWNEKN